MSIGARQNSQKEVSESKGWSHSQPSDPWQLAGYYNTLDLVGNGKLSKFAGQGTAPVSYDQLTAQQLRAMGGAGATRELGAQRVRDDAMQRVTADPRLSQFQAQYAGQQADRDYWAAMDAIRKESEAGLTSLAASQRLADLEAQKYNAGLSQEDLKLLADIYFGGKGQYTTESRESSGSGRGSGWGFDVAYGNFKTPN